MNTSLAFTVFLCSFATAAAQNLVPNPGFEELNSCPHGYGELFRANNWFRSYSSPDLYNACDGTDTASVPYNFFGYQNAATGQGYAGFWGYGINELLGIRLNEPLSVGTSYWASMRVSWTTNVNDQNNAAMYASNNMGILCTMDSLFGQPAWYPSVNRSHMHSEDVISDSLGWTLISGQFTADSAYQYLYVGNFYENALTETLLMDPNGNELSYYYVDDVCLSTDSGECIVSMGVAPSRPVVPLTILYDPQGLNIRFIGVPDDLIEIQVVDLLGRLRPIRIERTRESITVVQEQRSDRIPDVLVVHLIGHNWHRSMKILTSTN